MVSIGWPCASTMCSEKTNECWQICPELTNGRGPVISSNSASKIKSSRWRPVSDELTSLSKPAMRGRLPTAAGLRARQHGTTTLQQLATCHLVNSAHGQPSGRGKGELSSCSSRGYGRRLWPGRVVDTAPQTLPIQSYVPSLGFKRTVCIPLEILKKNIFV